MIFAQFGLGITSFALGGPIWSLILVAFFLVRFMQFMVNPDNSSIGFQVLQSNLMATILAGIGLTFIGSGGLVTAQSIMLLMDAFMGMRQFSVTNRREI
tara:strand:+ start:1235 stop:1531 length:297 start_codon:yes stop_codon:yes gene_type:complete